MTAPWSIAHNPTINGRSGGLDWKWTILHAELGLAAIRFLPRKRDAVAKVDELIADPDVDPRVCPHCRKSIDAVSLTVIAWHAAVVWAAAKPEFGPGPGDRPVVNAAMRGVCHRCGPMDEADPADALTAAIANATTVGELDDLFRVGSRWPSLMRSDAHYDAAERRELELRAVPA